MRYVIGTDIGTTGTKTLLVDEKGKVIASALEEYPLSHPKPGWAEQDPALWWNAAKKTIHSVIEKSKVNPNDVKGVGLSGQMHSSILLDKTNKVLRPAILWCDQRTTKECEWIMKTVGEKEMFKLVSNPALEGFTAPKIIWVRNNEPAIYKKIAKVMLPKDYIRFMLTGEIATEVSDASGTVMFDVKNRKWSKKLLEKIGVPEGILPPVYESTDICGRINENAAKETGLAKGTPVVGGGADNTCAAVGTGIVEPGLVSASIGTSGVIFAHTETPKEDSGRRTHTFCHSAPGKWYLMGVMLSAGMSLRWLRDNVCSDEAAQAAKEGVDPYDIMGREAAKISPGSQGLIFLPYLNGERTPHKDANARGVFFGISGAHSRAHMIRSVMEGVAFGLRDSLEIIKSTGAEIKQIRTTGGGSRSALWRQIMADVFNAEVVTVNSSDGACYGAALLAGVGCGIYKDVQDAVKKTIKVVSSTKPVKESARTYEKYYAEFRSLYPALKKEFAAVAKI